MNLKSILLKRNYIYLYNKFKCYPKSVNRFSNNFNSIQNYRSILDYITLEKFEKVIAVASGPSSRNIDFNDKNLYFCCNNSIELLKNKNCYYVYSVNDEFYLQMYLKKFTGDDFWLTTLFYFFLNNGSKNKNNLIKEYLGSYSRQRKEFLITNDNNNFHSNKINKDLEKIFQSWNYVHYGVNSGFNNLVLAAITAKYGNLPLESYGLDMGEGGEAYYDRQTKLGKSIKSDFSKGKVEEFLKILAKELDFKNYSNFKT